MCVFFICTQSHAQSDNLQITGVDSPYGLNDISFILDDPNGEYTVRDVVGKFRNGDITTKNTSDSFVLKQSPQWIILPIRNSSDQTEWALDFGNLKTGRTGILNQLLVYEASQKTIFFNGFSTGSTNKGTIKDNQYIEVTVPKNKDLLFVLYLYPTEYKETSLPLKLAPTLINNPTDNDFNAFIINYLPTVIMISVLITFLGFVITGGVGFIPIIIYYLTLLVWYIYAEGALFPSIIGLGIAAPTIPIVASLLINITCLFTVPVRYSHTPIRILLFFLMAVGIISAFLFTVFDVFNIGNKYNISIILSGLSLLTSIIFLYKNRSPHLEKSNNFLIAWIGCLFLAETTIMLENFNILPHIFLYTQIDKISLYAQFIFLFIGVIIAIRSEHARRMANYIRHNQRTNSILNAQKNKENTDHSRLLRVIEREREIMEELRARESERTEEMRDAKIIADEANQAKSAFLAVVSHEIRTPMTGIMGMVKMLEDTPLSKEQKDFVMTIGDSGQAMLALLNDILDFSKIEDGSMDLENIQFDLRRVLNSVKMLMSAHSDQKNLQFILNIDDAIPHTLYGNPTRLRQVILNLVGNALKFTSKGYVSITAQQDDSKNDIHCIRFEVADTGLGISKRAQENLFTPFSQADNTISRKYGGTGLGLAICKTLVDAMGGEITLNSREGAGTTFSFTLPFSADHKKISTQQKVIKPIPVIENKNFLVVDDNEINLKVIEGFLKKLNHHCVAVNNGQEALNILENNRKFDALFLDIEMPGMSGIDLAGHVLDNDKTSHIPMIAVTGNVGADDIQRYRNVGFKNHIAKPIEPETLNEVIFKLNHNNDETTLSTGEEKIKITKPPMEPPKKTNRGVVGKTLDEVMLKGLKDGLGSKQTADLIQDLFIKADEIVGQLNDLKISKDKTAARMRAHELKGMAGNFGLKALSDKSDEIEKICKDKERDFDDIIPHIEDLSTLVERSKFTVKEFLGD